MLEPADYTPGKLLFKVKPKRTKRSKKPKSAAAEEEQKKNEIEKLEKKQENEKELTLEEREEQAVAEMTEAEIKFQKNKIHYIKAALDQTKGKTHRDLIEEQNEKLSKLPLHWDLEGK